VSIIQISRASIREVTPLTAADRHQVRATWLCEDEFLIAPTRARTRKGMDTLIRASADWAKASATCAWSSAAMVAIGPAPAIGGHTACAGHVPRTGRG